MTPLLHHILQAHPDPTATRTLAAAVTDWPSLLAEAAPQGLMPLLAWTLNRACPDAVPPEILHHLQQRLRANAERTLALSAELLRLLDLFPKPRIPVVPFKGPAIAWLLYETPALREMSDLDLLIRPQDLDNALHLLQRHAYHPAYKGAPTNFYRRGRELPLTRHDGKVAIDLHWALLPAHFHLDPEPFFHRLAPVTIAGRRILTFCPEDLLLYLCVHGSKHAWYSLHWLADITRLLDRHPDAVEPALARAREAGLARPFLLGLSLARDPAQALPSGGHRYQLSLTDRLTDRFNYIYGLLAPTPAEWMALRLPAALFPAYYLVRPVRLTLKYTAVAARRLLT